MRVQPLLLSCLCISLMWISGVSGQHAVRVIDQTQQPLPGVHITSDNNSFLVVTDELGEFYLPDTLSNSLTIYASIIGYKIKEVSVKDLRKHPVIILEPVVSLEEIVLVGRTGISQKDMIQQVNTISREAIQATQPQTSADALSQHSNVFIQKSQMGGGSPILRGFEANRVLLVVDGVRMNNIIYRSGHLQNVITVDNQVMGQMEVLFGPGSLMYGSDALGGVIHFRTRDPKLRLSPKQPKYSGGWMARYNTANNEKTIHSHLEVAGKRWAGLTSITLSDFDDLRTGSRRTAAYPDYGKRPYYARTIGSKDTIVINQDPNLQVGTGYDQLDLLQKVKFQINAKSYLLANFQMSTSSDIPRYDQLIEPGRGDQPLRWAQWYYGPQVRGMGSLHYHSHRSRLWADRMIWTIASQRIHEDRYSRVFGDEVIEAQKERVWVHSITADIRKNLTDNWQLDYGIDAQYNQLDSRAVATNIVIELEAEEIFPRYSNGDTYSIQMAAFGLIKGKIGLHHTLTGGVRHTRNTLSYKYLPSQLIEWPVDFLTGQENNNSAWTGSIAYQYNRDQYRFAITGATAFRVPNVDDVTKIRVNGGEVSVPNTELAPEYAKTLEASIGWINSMQGELTITGFATGLDDAIVRAPYPLPDGSTSLINRGDTLQTIGNVNAASAIIYGLSLQGKWNYQLWKIEGGWNYTWGRQMLEGEESPLSHIPPIYGRVSLTYQPTKWSAGVHVRYNGMKPIAAYGDSADNPEFATPEGSLSWMTCNVYGNYNIKDNLNIRLGLENVLDIHYRSFASGLSAPGRSLSIAIVGGW